MGEGDGFEAPSSPPDSPRSITGHERGGDGDFSAVRSTCPSMISRPPTGSPSSSCLEESSGKGQQAAAAAAEVLVVSPVLAGCKADVSVQPGEVVRWIQGEYGERVTGGEKEEAVGVAGSGNGGGGNGKREPMTVIIVSDVLDAPLTREITSDGSCAELLFDHPGSYTYHVCSGPVTKGRVIVKDAPAAATIMNDSSEASRNEPLPVGERGGGGIAEPGSAGATVDSDITAAYSIDTGSVEEVAPPSSPSRAKVDARATAGETVVFARGVAVERDARVREAVLKFQGTLLHSNNRGTMDATRIKGLSSASESSGGQSPGVSSCASPVALLEAGDEVASDSASPPAVLLPKCVVENGIYSPGRSMADGQGKGVGDAALQQHLSKRSAGDEILSCDTSVLASSDSERRLSQQGDGGQDVTEEQPPSATAACLGSYVAQEYKMGDVSTRKVCREDNATVDCDSEGDPPSGAFSL